MSCRVHGSGCSTPWGYDEAHTDQDHPYTPEQLAEREEGPHFYAYPTHEAYLEAWHLWRAYRRDERLTADEAAVRWALIEERIRGALPPDIAELKLHPEGRGHELSRRPRAENVASRG